MMLSALPALNHSICSSLIVWFAMNATCRAVGLRDEHGDRVLGAAAASPTIEMRSSSPMLS